MSGPAADPESILAAVERLRGGGVVAFPTETVYGLGADAMRPDAIKLIFKLKGRPSDRPLTLHVSDAEMARRCVATWTDRAEELASRFWPGPLTMVLPRGPMVPDEAVAGALDVGVRCPDHPAALALISAFGGPLVAPSANRSDHLPPTTPADVRAEFKDADLFLLDAGACVGGVESTVLRLGAASGKPDRILRRGPIGPEELGGDVVEQPQIRHGADSAGLYRVFEIDAWPSPIEHAPGEVVVIACANADLASIDTPYRFIELPAEADACAARLYTALREAESINPSRIAIALPTGEGALWDAIRDRIERFAQRRP